jgi:hypothetical protein
MIEQKMVVSTTGYETIFWVNFTMAFLDEILPATPASVRWRQLYFHLRRLELFAFGQNQYNHLRSEL